MAPLSRRNCSAVGGSFAATGAGKRMRQIRQRLDRGWRRMIVELLSSRRLAALAAASGRTALVATAEQHRSRASDGDDRRTNVANVQAAVSAVTASISEWPVIAAGLCNAHQRQKRRRDIGQAAVLQLQSCAARSPR